MRPVRIRQEKDVTPRWQYEKDMAESLGFTCTPDAHRGPNWCSFQKGDVRVWQGRYWCRARVIDDRYRFHTGHATLGQALKNENGISYGFDSSPRQFSNCINPGAASSASFRDELDALVNTATDADDFAMKGCAEGIFLSRAEGRRYWAGEKGQKPVP